MPLICFVQETDSVEIGLASGIMIDWQKSSWIQKNIWIPVPKVSYSFQSLIASNKKTYYNSL